MTHSDKDLRAELAHLCGLIREGELTVDEFQRLQCLLREHVDLRRLYVQFKQFDAILQQRVGGGFPQAPTGEDGNSVLRLEISETGDVTPGDSVNALSTAAPTEAAGGNPPESATGSVAMPPLFGHVGWRQQPIIYNLAALLGVVTALWLVGGLIFTWTAQKEVFGDDQPRPPRPPVMARLSRSMDARWSTDTVNVGAFLRNGQQLELVAGLAEVTYLNGAVVLLEAPISFTLDKQEAMPASKATAPVRLGYLESGRLSVRGLTGDNRVILETPVAAVKLGRDAQAGVAVGQQNDVAITVFAGTVEMNISDHYGAWRQQIETGASVRFNPRDARPVIQRVDDAGAFVRRLPEEQPHMLLHWDFDSIADNGRLVLDRSGQGHHGRVVSNLGRATLEPGPSGFGKALALSGQKEFIELIEPQWSRLDDSFSEFTVALWINPTDPSPPVTKQRRSEAMIMGKMGFEFRRGWQFILRPDNTPVFDFYRTAADKAATTVVGTKTVPNGVFSHLAMVFKGGEYVRLYLNGELIGQLKESVPPRINGANRVNLQVGNRGDGIPLFFKGLVDDVKVYQSALTNAEVLRLLEPDTEGRAKVQSAQATAVAPPTTDDDKLTVPAN